MTEFDDLPPDERAAAIARRQAEALSREPSAEDELRPAWPLSVWVAPDQGEFALAFMPGWEEVKVVPLRAAEANLPSTQWMEAIVNRAIDRVCALLGTSMSKGTRTEVVRQALNAPPPADDGGPNDPITAVGKAAIEEARRLPPMPPEAVATTLVRTMRHEPWKEPDAAQAWQLLAGMCILEAAQAMIADG